MNQKEKRNWEINIENAVADAATKAGTEVVESVFLRYDARNLYDLSPCYYSEVFADLQQIINDSLFLASVLHSQKRLWPLAFRD